MRSILFFNIDGIPEQMTISENIFQHENFKEFDKYCIINNYIILYNSTAENTNKVFFPFTDRKFNGSIIIIRVINGIIENLTIKKFLKIYSKNLSIERQNSESDSDPFDESCNLEKVC